ncbi:hypothetical protein EDC04DRAFT_3094143 [Pisolithus marmoratus]|nr:hypothetical protein EDC04DRAFT_3094143 [Pisolithus marmoratus]
MFLTLSLSTNMVDAVADTVAVAVQTVYYHSRTASSSFDYSLLIGSLVATLALSLWDFVTMFGDEVRYIWPMKRRHVFKWLYIFHRYFLLATQIMCQIALPFLPAMMSSPAGLALLVSLTVLTQCTNFTLEFILAFRIFALFGRRPWVSRLLGCLTLAEVLCCTPPIISFYRSYGGGIMFQLTSTANIQIAFSMVMHSTFIALTVVKHISIVRASCVGRNAISQFTLDGTATFLMVTGLLGLAFATSTMPDVHPIIVFFWALAVHSICGGRLILGMARIQDRIRGLQEDESIMLTTHIDICFSEDLD